MTKPATGFGGTEDTVLDDMPSLPPPSVPAAGTVVDDSDIDPNEEADNGPTDFVYPDSKDQSSSTPLTPSFETIIPNGAIINGFFVLDNLIIHNGTFYIVTHNRSVFPALKEDLVWRPHVSGQVEREPNEEAGFLFSLPRAIYGDWRFGDPREEVQLDHRDPIRTVKHYYHWWGEIILGGWHVYSRIGLDPDGTFHPERLRLSDRFLLPVVVDGKWRDEARVVGPFMHAAFPQAAIEERDQWLDLIRLNRTIVFQRALVTNRRAAHQQ
ncbi:hypothetical protein P691DRAFT_776725 [Macrolepiota fuliginosa MF-IS2]|uniref:Uncharacterized protein n=1 Tax=Macrolepiota fuliginosa MF-IS2 TaxID=1400762 RepID=A0A9P5XB62_9AGAR|nr:hypothetical protein P691DRAFT_776725 [Macrolepiota fuliginosa MF-IS2]